MNQTVVTRFAPSPTGYLHVGGARTALFDWLLARHFGGRFLLRIEDTDLARSTQQACDQLLEDLRWLGLQWDNADLLFQSKRTDIYNALIEKLIAESKGYKAYETAEELDALRKQAEKDKRVFIYRRPQLTDAQARQYESEGRPHVVRFAMPVRDYRFDDAVLGPGQGVPATQVQDFVIRKSDGMPTYHFAVVVDDEAMGITHVLRGQEHLLNTVLHIGLQEALGYRRPIYMHLPVIQNLDGSKMGKRDRDKKVRVTVQMWMKNQKRTVADLSAATGIGTDRLAAWIDNSKSQLDLSEQKLVMPAVGLRESDLPEVLVHDFRRNGYIPEVLLNFLALLGFSPGENIEKMTMDDMVQRFAIEGIGKSNAKFDRNKLLSFNTDFCATAPTSRLVPAFRDFLSVNPDSPLNRATDAQLGRIVEMGRGVHNLRQLDDKSSFMLLEDDAVQYAPDAVEKVLKKNDGQGLKALKDIRPLLETVTDWKHTAIEAVVTDYCTRAALGLGKVAQPIRVAISGNTISPPIFETLEFMGKTSVLSRIDRCIAIAR